MSRADVPPFFDYAPQPICIPHSPLSTGVKGGAKMYRSSEARLDVEHFHWGDRQRGLELPRISL